jgi:hypothetical protein
MKRVLAWSTSLLLMVCATGAIAGGSGNSILQGDYGFTGTGVCNEGASVGLFTFNGTRTFHGDGTGTSHFFVHRVAQGSLGPDTAFEVVDAFTYEVNGDGSWTRAIDPGSTKGTILNGPSAGVTFSVDPQPASTGFVSDDVENLIVGLLIQSVARKATEVTSESVLETVTRSDGKVTQRICQRSFVLIKPL